MENYYQYKCFFLRNITSVAKWIVFEIKFSKSILKLANAH